MLGAAPNRLHHLVWLGSGKDEDHVVRRFLQSLEQRVLGPGGEHVDLVQQIHLGPARGPEGHLGQKVAHIVDLVVRRRIQFMEVERRPSVYGLAGVTPATWLTGLGLGAIQRLGQDPGRRRLTRSTRPAE